MTVHDRRSTDTLKAGQYASVEIPDPYDPESKLIVLRQLRGDPLARLHAHHQIDDCQYHAGRRYQGDWHLVEQGAQAIDPSKEKVDGGAAIDPLPQRRLEASDRLKAANASLGRNGQKLIRAFLVDEEHIEHLAVKVFGRPGARWANYYGKSLRDALDILAMEYGMAHKGSRYEPSEERAL